MERHDDLTDLRRRIGQSTPKRTADMTVQELADYIDTLVHLLHVRIDGLTPGADDKTHYEHHTTIQNLSIASAKFWADVRAKIVAGALLGLGLVATIAFAFVVYRIARSGM